jgi:hypothetical protein
VVRRTVYNFYKIEKRLPTLAGLHKNLKDAIQFKGCINSLRAILKGLGFRWKKTKSNRAILIETPEIRNKRISYLKDIERFRKEGRQIIYMDESYILSSHVSGKSWSDDSKEGLHCPVSKGDRLIIVHAGGENGFVKDALLMWQSRASTGDYHNQMNFDNYGKWLREKLIPNLPPNAVVVIDNAPYHNVLEEKCPNSNSTKVKMMNWLSEKNIPYSPEMFKPELYALIKIHKPHYQKYRVDKIMASYGHTILRLPPYHPDLNPIETIWAQVKQWVGARNVSFKINDVLRLCEEKFREMGEDD